MQQGTASIFKWTAQRSAVSIFEVASAEEPGQEFGDGCLERAPGCVVPYRYRPGYSARCAVLSHVSEDGPPLQREERGAGGLGVAAGRRRTMRADWVGGPGRVNSTLPPET